jgi:hypothetical protein
MKLVRFYLPIEPKKPDDAVWSVIRTLSSKIGEQLTTHLRAIADANPLLKGIISLAISPPTYSLPIQKLDGGAVPGARPRTRSRARFGSR